MVKSLYNGMGYFKNDDRCSGGAFDEDDILACAHHGGMLKRSDWKLQGGFCMACEKPLCLHCTQRAQKFGCEGPDVKRLEQAVNNEYRRSQNAKVLGI